MVAGVFQIVSAEPPADDRLRSIMCWKDGHGGGTSADLNKAYTDDLAAKNAFGGWLSGCVRCPDCVDCGTAGLITQGVPGVPWDPFAPP